MNIKKLNDLKSAYIRVRDNIDDDHIRPACPTEDEFKAVSEVIYQLYLYCTDQIRDINGHIERLQYEDKQRHKQKQAVKVIEVDFINKKRKAA